MVPIRKFRRRVAPRLRALRWLATWGDTSASSASCAHVTAVMALPETPSLPLGTDPIETPAHINRLAWAWLREFQQDLQDDCDNRLEANNR